MLEYLFGGLVCAVFGVIVYNLAKKDKSRDEERVKSLTEEQKRILTETPYMSVEKLPNAALVQGLIYEIPKKTSHKAELVVLYYNQYFPNFRGEIIHLDLNMPLKTLEQQNLKAGDFVKVILNEDKTPKIIMN